VISIILTAGLANSYILQDIRYNAMEQDSVQLAVNNGTFILELS